MMRKAKYIMIDYGGIDLPIIFSEVMTHSEVARAYPHHEIVSAGFVTFGPDGVCDAYGESISLGGIRARVEDREIINRSILGIKR